MKQEIKNMPHNGKLLEEYISKHQINKSRLGRQMGVSASNINVYFERDTLQTSIWWRASLALDYNFLAEIAGISGVNFTSKCEQELQQKLTGMQKELDELKLKLSVYESIIKK